MPSLANFLFSNSSIPNAFTTLTPEIVSCSTEVRSAMRSCTRPLSLCTRRPTPGDNQQNSGKTTNAISVSFQLIIRQMVR